MYLQAMLLLLPALGGSDFLLDSLENALLDDMDVDRDGLLTLPEFNSYFTGGGNVESLNEQEFMSNCLKLGPIFHGYAETVFSLLDHDSNEVFNAADVRVLFATFDNDGDGVVDHTESHEGFRQFMATVMGTSLSHDTSQDDGYIRHDEI